MAKRPTKHTEERPRTPDHRIPAAGWLKNAGTYIAGCAELEEHDLVARDMERKWGVDRLRLLVDAEWREKFDRQRYLLNRAIWRGELEDVRRESRRMCAAWRKLDQLAVERPERDVAVMETALPDGRVLCIVPDGEVSRVQADGRAVVIWELSEIASILSTFGILNEAKYQWPGCEIVAVRTRAVDPLQGIDASGELDDPIDFTGLGPPAVLKTTSEPDEEF